jgi:3-phosphoshikimate 1-carboxyvinyltransferase
MRDVVVQVPGDKSITHRALLFGSLATGVSRVRGALDSADTRSTAGVMRALGIGMPSALGSGFAIAGSGIHGWNAPSRDLDCGNSGTTARLVMGALAGCAFDAVLRGDESLQSRPMRRVTTPLTQMGAQFTELGAPDRLPVCMRGGALSGIQHFSAQSSAQVKSALLLAGLVGNATVTVTEPRLSRDHTERMLRAMGCPLEQRRDANGHHVAHIHGSSVLQPIDIDVPGDFSSAAFFIACGLLHDSVRVTMPHVGLNPGRTGMLDALRRMNAVVELADQAMVANEPTGAVRASAASLRAIEITGDEIPALIDEIPILAMLAARAEGESRITGAGELRVKETDRIRAIVENLRAVGVDAEELEDGMVIRGTEAPLSGRVVSHGDHRIAMAFGVLGAQQGNDIRIDDPSVVDVSFPNFWNALRHVMQP